MIRTLYFCFVFLIFTNQSMAVELEQIEKLHQDQIDFLENRILELDDCIRYFRSKGSEANLHPICSIFSRLNTTEENANSKRRWNSLNQAYVDYTALVEKGRVSEAEAKTIKKQRNRIADLLDDSANRIGEFLRLYAKYKK